MPVRKFRSVQEMDDHLWREPGDRALLRAIREVWSFSAKAFPRRFSPGVYKHRSLAEAERLRRRWEDEDFERLWEGRQGSADGDATDADVTDADQPITD